MLLIVVFLLSVREDCFGSIPEYTNDSKSVTKWEVFCPEFKEMDTTLRLRPW